MLDRLKDPIQSLDTLTIAELKTIQDQLEARTKEDKAYAEAFQAVMLRRFAGDAKAAFTEAKKETGVVHRAASNTLNLTVDRDKKVEWDQDKLPAIFKAMAAEDARHYAVVKYSVPEDKYKAAPPAVQKTLQAARTIKPGKMKFSLSNVELADEAEAA